MATQITVVGNLTHDPELRYTPSGSAAASFVVAVNDRKFNRESGQYEDVGATFWKCNVWRATAEHVAVSLAKGDHVVVVGTVKDHTFESRDGEKRTVKEIEAEEVAVSLRFATALPRRERNSRHEPELAPAG